jgi:hypothetical protein
MSNLSSDPIIARREAKIADGFAKRDALMDDFDRNAGRIRVIEATIALDQTILAGLVEAADPARAKRLRDMAAANEQTWAKYDAAHAIG